MLASGGETGIYMGDLAQKTVQFERTAWVSSFDILPLMSLETKRRLIDQAIAQQALIITAHTPFPGLGRMTRNEQGHRHWEPVQASGDAGTPG